MTTLLDEKLISRIRNTGLSSKAARVYAAAVGTGEASIVMLSEKSGIKRTTIYDLLGELQEAGALFPVRRGKKTYYAAELPENLIQHARERLEDSESHAELVKMAVPPRFNQPHMYFLQGPSGFKKIWNMIFDSKLPEYRIITNGIGFLDFVKEKYILDQIIQKKRASGIKSKHMIVDSSYARTIVAKDKEENRISRFLPSSCKISFTEIICGSFVAFISPRIDNTLFVIESGQFAESRKHLFDATWEKLPTAQPAK